MNVKELKEIISSLPDDMVVAQYSDHTGDYYSIEPEVDRGVSSDGTLDDDILSVTYDDSNPVLVFKLFV